MADQRSPARPPRVHATRGFSCLRCRAYNRRGLPVQVRRTNSFSRGARSKGPFHCAKRNRYGRPSHCHATNEHGPPQFSQQLRTICFHVLVIHPHAPGQFRPKGWCIHSSRRNEWRRRRLAQPPVILAGRKLWKWPSSRLRSVIHVSPIMGKAEQPSCAGSLVPTPLGFAFKSSEHRTVSHERLV